MTTTWSATNKNANPVLSNGGLTVAGPGGATFYPGRSDTAILSGDKKYFESTINVISGANSAGVGLCNVTEGFADAAFLGSSNFGFGYYQDGNVYFGGASLAMLATFAQGDIICWATNGASKAWVRVNGGNWNNDILANQNPATGVGGFDISGFGNIFPAYTVQSTGQLTTNFGATAFAQTPPAGFTGFDTSGGVTATVALTEAADVVASAATVGSVSGVTATVALTEAADVVAASATVGSSVGPTAGGTGASTLFVQQITRRPSAIGTILEGGLVPTS